MRCAKVPFVMVCNIKKLAHSFFIIRDDIAKVGDRESSAFGSLSNAERKAACSCFCGRSPDEAVYAALRKKLVMENRRLSGFDVSVSVMFFIGVVM